MDEKLSAAMKPAEAHALIGTKVISRASFYAGLKRKEIPSVTVGKRILIPRARFLAWLEGAQAGVR